MNVSEIAARLKQARLFRVLPRRDRDALAKGSTVMTFGADSIVIYRGDSAENVYLILEGSVAAVQKGRMRAVSSTGAHGEIVKRSRPRSMRRQGTAERIDG